MIETNILKPNDAIEYIEYTHQEGFDDGIITLSLEDINRYFFEEKSQFYYLIEYRGNFKEFESAFDYNVFSQNAKRIILSVNHCPEFDIFAVNQITQYVNSKFAKNNGNILVRTKFDNNLVSDEIEVDILFA